MITYLIIIVVQNI